MFRHAPFLPHKDDCDQYAKCMFWCPRPVLTDLFFVCFTLAYKVKVSLFKFKQRNVVHRMNSDHLDEHCFCKPLLSPYLYEVPFVLKWGQLDMLMSSWRVVWLCICVGHSAAFVLKTVITWDCKTGTGCNEIPLCFPFGNYICLFQNVMWSTSLHLNNKFCWHFCRQLQMSP